MTMAEKKTKKPPKKPTPRAFMFEGKEAVLADDIGRVSIVDGRPLVCQTGLIVRMGLGSVPAPEFAAELYPLLELCPGEERPKPGEMLEDWPVFAWMTQQDTAECLGITTRHLQNLETKGLPNVGRGATKRYALPHTIIWHRAYAAQRRPKVLPWEVAEAQDTLNKAEDELRGAMEDWGL